MTDASEPKKLSGTIEHRGEARVAGRIGATMRRRTEKAVQISVQDISVTGFRAEWPNKLHKDDLVWLRLPGLEAREAKVVWSDHRFVGCRFLIRLHPAVLEAIVKGVA